MQNVIDLRPVKQTGHNCKITAIAAVDLFFATQFEYEPIPLHKKKDAPTSIRKLSKKRKSIQGELLEVGQLSQIFADLSYDTEIIDFKDNYDLFRENIIQHIDAGNLLIAFFAVDVKTGLPSDRYEQNNEHAAILHGYHKQTDTLIVTHWDKRRETTIKDFYSSSMVLPEKREPEYYVNIKHLDKDKKYELVKDDSSWSSTKSIVPQSNSGFQAKLLVIKKPEQATICVSRRKLLNSAMIPLLFKQLKIKTDELIRKGSIVTFSNLNYKNIVKVAQTLNSQLEQCLCDFYSNALDLNDFKKACIDSIEAAEPEFKKHRGWYKIHEILRNILGILAILTVIPALVISISTKQGYIGTFFTTPRTDSEEKLSLFKKKINLLE